MKNEYAKLGFICALREIVESQTDIIHKLPAKVYLNYVVSDFSIPDQKVMLAELKKKRIISNFKIDGGDFVITKPSRSGIIDFLYKIQQLPADQKPKTTDSRIRFNDPLR